MDIDPEQLQKVQEFRKKYKEEGIYGTFTDTDNFKETLQIHRAVASRLWLRKLLPDNPPRRTVNNDGSRRWRIRLAVAAEAFRRDAGVRPTSIPWHGPSTAHCRSQRTQRKGQPFVLYRVDSQLV